RKARLDLDGLVAPVGGDDALGPGTLAARALLLCCRWLLCHVRNHPSVVSPRRPRLAGRAGRGPPCLSVLPCGTARTTVRPSCGLAGPPLPARRLRGHLRLALLDVLLAALPHDRQDAGDVAARLG